MNVTDHPENPETSASKPPLEITGIDSPSLEGWAAAFQPAPGADYQPQPDLWRTTSNAAGVAERPWQTLPSDTTPSDKDMSETTVGINLHDFRNVPTPVPWSFGILDPSAFNVDFQETTTSTVEDEFGDSGGLQPSDPGAPQSGWGDFLDTLPAGSKMEKDSVPNHKQPLSETTTPRDAPSQTHNNMPSPPPAGTTSLPTARTNLSLVHANVAGSQVLPDDSKKTVYTGTSDVKPGSSPRLPGGDTNMVDESRQVGLGTTGPSATETDMTSDPGTEVTGRAGRDMDSRRPVVAGSDWPVDEEAEVGRSGNRGEEISQGVQLVVFVAPCVAAFLSVLGVVLVVRFAIMARASRKNGNQQIRGNPHYQQQNGLTRPQPEDDLHIQDHGLY